MFVVMRIGTDILGEDVRIMVDLTTRTIPNNGGFDVAATSEEGDSSADGSEGTSKKRQKTKDACVDTPLLSETIKALTDSLSGRLPADTVARQGQELPSAGLPAAPVVTVAPVSAVAPFLSAVDASIANMKKWVEAVDLLKRSYAQMKEAEKDKEGEDYIVVVKLREQYKIVE